MVSTNYIYTFSDCKGIIIFLKEKAFLLFYSKKTLREDF